MKKDEFSDPEDGFTRAGPVKITRADGTIEIQPAYTVDELVEIVSPSWKTIDKHKWAALMRYRRWEAAQQREKDADA